MQETAALAEEVSGEPSFARRPDGDQSGGGRPRRPYHLLVPVALVAITALGFAAWVREVARPVTVAGLRVGGVDVGGVPFDELPARLAPIAARALEEPLLLAAPAVDGKVRLRRGELGFTVDTEALADAARRAGKSGDLGADLRARLAARRGRLDLALPLRLDRTRAALALDAVKEAVDRAPVDATLDLDHHGVAPERDGVLVDVYASLLRVERAVRQGAPTVELATLALPARVSRRELTGIDIGTVLATWETKYSTATVDSDRTYNLKVGAEHLNGHILKPHEIFSFNEVVGDRTEKEGYRVAPVIAGGELIDGLAGGMCQIASTLHAAAFFAGLDIVSSTPHSRPSAYIPLGLDSTVVYPSTDLKLRNPFDFPVVMHYSVFQGAVRVELLGRAKPVKVVFEREITRESPFGSERRGVPDAPRGQRFVLQEGYPGYSALRRRYVLDAAAVLPRSLGGPTEPIERALARAHLVPRKVERWSVHYPATTQIEGYGTGPAKMHRRDPPPKHHIPPIPPSDKPIARIVR